MYSNRSGLILGFHGCDETIRNEVLNHRKELKPSTNHWDWLGSGIYFWENNPTRALRFAEEQSQRTDSNIIKPPVLGAVIDLGYCLDLLDEDNISLVKKAHTSLVKHHKLTNKVLPINKAVSTSNSDDLLIRSLDCAVINHLNLYQDEIKKFVSVKGIFTEGKPLYENAGFREKDHIQICIRDSSCIKNYFLPIH